jgi:hypothetical protein
VEPRSAHADVLGLSGGFRPAAHWKGTPVAAAIFLAIIDQDRSSPMSFTTLSYSSDLVCDHACGV